MPVETPDRRWLTVDSSNVGAVRYWPATKKLDMIFRRSCGSHQNFVLGCRFCTPKKFYRYSKVTIEEFVSMLFHESIGGYFSAEIKATSADPEQIELVLS